jgi:hypothetical protein
MEGEVKTVANILTAVSIVAVVMAALIVGVRNQQSQRWDVTLPDGTVLRNAECVHTYINGVSFRHGGKDYHAMSATICKVNP